jgi:hypothetical protein
VQIHARYQQGMQFDLARLPNDPALLQRVVRDLADVLERQDAELTETKARLADFLSALKRQRCNDLLINRRRRSDGPAALLRNTTHATEEKFGAEARR